MKKVLIWNSFSLTNTGGPAGYIYNIHEYLKKHPTGQIVFLSDILPDVPSLMPYHTYDRPESNFVVRIYRRIKLELQYLFDFVWRAYNTPFVGIPDDFDINQYDFVHLHCTMHTMRFRNTFPDYRGKIIVTSHQPCPWTYEYEEYFGSYIRIFRKFSLKGEAAGFANADYIMYPCEGAKEPYEVEHILKKTLDYCKDKIFYVPSCILDFKIDEGKMQKYSELGIPEDSFVITYFGRHISVKGYDILKKVGEALLDKYPNLYFLCAGKGEIEPLNHPRWIELGFISNTAELLYQSNLYILPNRETYFDLITLEILRSSTPLILSYTGGNKYFKGLPTEEIAGMDFFEINDIASLINKVETHICEFQNNRTLYRQKGEANRKLFLSRFTMDHYMDNYLKEINKLV